MENGVQLRNNWIVINTLLDNLSCLDFNLKVLEINKGKRYLEENKLLYGLLDYAIESNNLKLVQVFCKFLQVHDSRLSKGEKTPLEYSIKCFNNNETSIIEEIMKFEPVQQSEIKFNSQNKKCFLLYLIKNNLPLPLIKQGMTYFLPVALQSYTDREEKSFLYHAIHQENLELAKGIISLFSAQSFYRNATDGTCTFQLAMKMKNIEIKELVRNYVEFKETQEFLESEWAIDPKIPKNLLMLKRKLVQNQEKREPFKFVPSQLLKPKRRKSLPQKSLNDFDDFSNQMSILNIKGSARDSPRKIITIQSVTPPFSQSDISGNTTPYGGSLIQQQHEKQFESLIYKPTRISYEKRFSVFHSIFTESVNFNLIECQTVIDNLKYYSQLYREIYKGNLHLIEQQEYQQYSVLQLFKGSKMIDNADLKYKSKLPLRQVPFRKPEPPQVKKNQKGAIINSLSNYFQSRIAKKEPEIDQVSDIVLPIMTLMKQNNLKYTEVKASETIDPSKMTITQKILVNQAKQNNKKVANQLQKDYQEKLKIASCKTKEQEEQEEIEQELNQKLDIAEQVQDHRRNASEIERLIGEPLMLAIPPKPKKVNSTASLFLDTPKEESKNDSRTSLDLVVSKKERSSIRQDKSPSDLKPGRRGTLLLGIESRGSSSVSPPGTGQGSVLQSPSKLRSPTKGAMVQSSIQKAMRKLIEKKKNEMNKPVLQRRDSVVDRARRVSTLGAIVDQGKIQTLIKKRTSIVEQKQNTKLEDRNKLQKKTNQSLDDNASKDDLLEIDEEEFDNEFNENITDQDSKKIVNNSLETEIEDDELLIEDQKQQDQNREEKKLQQLVFNFGQDVNQQNSRRTNRSNRTNRTIRSNRTFEKNSQDNESKGSKQATYRLLINDIQNQEYVTPMLGTEMQVPIQGLTPISPYHEEITLRDYLENHQEVQDQESIETPNLSPQKDQNVTLGNKPESYKFFDRRGSKDYPTNRSDQPTPQLQISIDAHQQSQTSLNQPIRQVIDLKSPKNKTFSPSQEPPQSPNNQKYNDDFNQQVKISNLKTFQHKQNIPQKPQNFQSVSQQSSQKPSFFPKQISQQKLKSEIFEQSSPYNDQKSMQLLQSHEQIKIVEQSQTEEYSKDEISDFVEVSEDLRNSKSQMNHSKNTTLLPPTQQIKDRNSFKEYRKDARGLYFSQTQSSWNKSYGNNIHQLGKQNIDKALVQNPEKPQTKIYRVHSNLFNLERKQLFTLQQPAHSQHHSHIQQIQQQFDDESKGTQTQPLSKYYSTQQKFNKKLGILHSTNSSPYYIKPPLMASSRSGATIKISNITKQMETSRQLDEIIIEQPQITPINQRATNSQHQGSRYKSQEEENQIKKIVKNINVLRRMAGSPLRLYPQLCTSAKFNPSKSPYLTHNRINSPNSPLAPESVYEMMRFKQKHSMHDSSPQRLITHQQLLTTLPLVPNRMVQTQQNFMKNKESLHKQLLQTLINADGKNNVLTQTLNTQRIGLKSSASTEIKGTSSRNYHTNIQPEMKSSGHDQLTFGDQSLKQINPPHFMQNPLHFKKQINSTLPIDMLPKPHSSPIHQKTKSGAFIHANHEKPFKINLTKSKQ